MSLCSRFTEFALKFDMMNQKLLAVPLEALKIN